MDAWQPEGRAYCSSRSAGAIHYPRQKPNLLHGEGEVLYECEDLRISLASSVEACMTAAVVMGRRYAWRGYSVDHVAARAPSANEVTLVAAKGREVFGTLGVRLGSRSRLQCEALYALEVEAIRAEGRKVCEFTRLAVDPQHGTKQALAALFHVAFVYAYEIHRCDEILIEVNPRHVWFYERMLGFSQAGPERVCARVTAPAVLLRLDCAYAASQISRYGGHQSAGGRSLYPYFLAPNEAQLALSRARLSSAPVRSATNEQVSSAAQRLRHEGEWVRKPRYARHIGIKSLTKT